ncbi:hypothetical protein [Microbacterium sp.]|uniref:hypothetical protein n=1 Tax=Microbacterium sp. TaxID=51671 RepID=UPI003F954C3C
MRLSERGDDLFGRCINGLHRFAQVLLHPFAQPGPHSIIARTRIPAHLAQVAPTRRADLRQLGPADHLLALRPVELRDVRVDIGKRFENCLGLFQGILARHRSVELVEDHLNCGWNLRHVCSCSSLGFRVRRVRMSRAPS